MKKSEKTSKTALAVIPNKENKKGIDNHKKAATHFEAAAKYHLEAAKHHKNENHEKAAKSTVIAHGHSSLGNDAQRVDVKQHIMKM